MDRILDTQDKLLKLKIAAEVRAAIREIFAGVKGMSGAYGSRNDEVEIAFYSDLETSIRIPGSNGPRHFVVTVKEQY